MRKQMRTIDRMSENMVKGISLFSGMDEEDVRDSVAIENWKKGYKHFLKNPVSHYLSSIEERKRKIGKYKRLIREHREDLKEAKNEEEAQKHKNLIKRYRSWILKHKKAINHLRALILNEQLERESSAGEEIAKNKAKGIALEEVEEELKEQAKKVNMEKYIRKYKSKSKELLDEFLEAHPECELVELDNHIGIDVGDYIVTPYTVKSKVTGKDICVQVRDRKGFVTKIDEMVSKALALLHSPEEAVQ